MALVLVGAVTLVIGFFNDRLPGFIYVTIVTSLLAGVLLIVELLRKRSSEKPALAAGGEGQGISTWGGSPWGAGLSGTSTLERDDAEFGGLEASYDDEPSVVESPLYDSARDFDAVDEPQSEDAAWWAPAVAEDDELFQTTRLPDLETEWDSDRASWQEPELVSQAQPQPAMQRANASTDRETERFLAAVSQVRGVGPSKQAELLAHFKTLRRLRNASVDRLAEIPGISTTLAQRIYNELHN
ncbi:MAG: helix-hairpin-helix domain-containing protein [Egibacteraceae bacterium]